MYYIYIENGKINGRGQCPCASDGLICVKTDQEHYNHLDHYMWDGTDIVFNPNYKKEEYERQVEECRQNRECAYAAEVDCITSHINRLRDEEQTPEIEQEIAELQAERTAKVEEIKERYPYPEAPEEEEDGTTDVG